MNSSDELQRLCDELESRCERLIRDRNDAVAKVCEKFPDRSTDGTALHSVLILLAEVSRDPE